MEVHLCVAISIGHKLYESAFLLFISIGHKQHESAFWVFVSIGHKLYRSAFVRGHFNRPQTV